jgi:hypothetical protein
VLRYVVLCAYLTVQIKLTAGFCLTVNVLTGMVICMTARSCIFLLLRY